MEEDFFKKVYVLVRQVPYGKVTSYGAIARFLGSGKSARIVGWAMNASHQQMDYVPAHRVVNSQGLLTGFAHFPTPTLMEELLTQEGVKVINGKIIDFQKVYWDDFEDVT